MLLSCVFIYRFICARLFKYILNYVLIQQNVKQSLWDSFLDLHFKTVTFTLEKCLFSAFLNVFMLIYMPFMIECVIGGLKFATKSHAN